MKKCWVGLLFLVLSVLRADAEMREFNLPDGRSLQAEIMSYNDKLDKVELKLANGKRKKVSPSLFVEKDQKYIKEWAVLDGFCNKAFFKVSCKKNLEKKWKKEDDAFQVKYTQYNYILTLENRNAYPLKNIKVEYRIFYEQEKNDRRTKKVVVDKNVKAGVEKVSRILPRGKKELSTESVVLEKFEFNTGDFYVPGGDPETTTGEIKGIWVRMHITTAGGLTAVRNLFEPAGLEGKYAWPK